MFLKSTQPQYLLSGTLLDVFFFSILVLFLPVDLLLFQKNVIEYDIGQHPKNNVKLPI